MSRWIYRWLACAVLWLAVSLLLPAVSLAGTEATLPQAPPQALAAPPMELQWPPPSALTFETMHLAVQSLDLTLHLEDVKGALQALAMKETKTEVKIERVGDILFDFDKADLRPAAEPTLQQVAELIRQYPRAQVSIDGYTDAKGAEAYNLRLSDRRAAAVKSWLIQKGSMDGKHIKAKGWGKANPVAPNTHPDGTDNPKGRQKNRRVEVTVKK